MAKGKKKEKAKKKEATLKVAPEEVSENEESKKEETPLTELEQLKLDNTELQDKYLRTAADMDNMRRRMERERSELLKFGMESFFKDLMPVLDSFEKAIDGCCEDAAAKSSYSEGVTMVQKQLCDTLIKHGLKSIEAKGEPFDPNFHQAIQRVNSDDVETETVGEEYAKGYTLNGRLLRASMVSVLIPNEESQPSKEEEKGKEQQTD